MSTRTWVVTGSGGFLGSTIASRARGKGIEVVDPRVHLPSELFAAELARIAPEVVVHTAGPSSVAASFASAEEDFRSAVNGTRCVLESVRSSAPEALIVYLSSAAVYGEPIRVPIVEDDPIRPISPYGFHKAAAEMSIAEYVRIHSSRAVSLRIFSAYGPGLRRQVVHDLMRRCRPDEELVLDGTGEETRDFVYADDVARAVEQVVSNAPGRGEAYNVASGREVSLRSLAESLRRAGCAGDVSFTGRRRLGDPLRWCADISRLTSLGYRPSVSLDAGLADTWRWYRTSVEPQ
jgi:nucleoside-diphosphate-sugar epimerase